MTLLIAGAVHSQERHSYRPSEGFVSSGRTAELIAEAVLAPIYGKAEIEEQRPFKTALKGDVWIISGDPARRNPRYMGGNFEIHISKATGEILFLTHTK
ncbi:NTF2 fold immunity protein [Mitsuaria sp. CC2]|uniref:NTF2 fold immunity protein n=1 Tax=Mitsuaria sp. CC2 TaxID=3029186 RepID=UPI003BA0CE95